MVDIVMVSSKFDSANDSYLLQAVVRVFYGERTDGGIARCFIFSDAPNSGWKVKNAKATGETWCLIWKEAQVVRIIALKHGNEISYCGHGLVAAGYFWFLNYRELPLLATSNGYFATRHDGSDGDFAIAAPPLEPYLTPIHLRFTQLFKKSWFDSTPSAGFCVGGDNGYFLYVWPHGVNIANIKINLKLIAEQRRAVVMAQCDSTARPEIMTDSMAQYNSISTANASSTQQLVIPFDLRYFAPQYGEDEGGATGSAAAIAANYWRLYFQASSGQRFIANQRSPGGGEIHCVIDKNVIWIGGRVEIQNDGD